MRFGAWNVRSLYTTVARGLTKYKLHLVAVQFVSGGTRWRSWLRHCATIRKVAGSIPDGVIGIFH